MRIVILLSLIFNLTYAGRDGNGGNEIALRFTQIAQKSLKYMQDHIKANKLSSNQSQFKKINIKKLQNAIRETKVYVVTYKLCNKVDDKLCPNEDGFVAKNYELSNEIYINAKRWRSISFEEKIRITLHEYFGIIELETANYYLSSNIIIALNSSKNSISYSCQMSLLKEDNSMPLTSMKSNPIYKVLGDTTFLINHFGVVPFDKSSRIKNSSSDVIFRAIMSKNYIKGSIHIGKVDRKTTLFTNIKEINKTIFKDIVFFEAEPIGVKVFKKGDYLLQVSCTSI